jgi:uncharacterized membrane protein YcgQ (UPF0703/DUF1980 family)
MVQAMPFLVFGVALSAVIAVYVPRSFWAKAPPALSSRWPGGRQVLTRILLSCCAADGRPLKIGMEGDPPVGVANDQWVEVVGRYSATTEHDPINGEQIPHIEVIEWRQIEPPRNQYE